MLSDLYRQLPLQRTYLTVAMSKVSRSFVLVTPWLEEPLQQQMATAYLLCRTLDNIEDCGQPLEWQKARFAEFLHLLSKPSDAMGMLYKWEKYSWPGLNPEEAELMTLEGGLPLWLIYSSFPVHVRATCEHWISMMARGMESMLDPAQTTATTLHGDVRILTSVNDYNQYCYHVAGTVGGLGTELVISHYGLGSSVAERLLNGSDACGRALQKTNIIKDFAEDLDRNVCFLPSEWLRQIDYLPLRRAGAPAEWSFAVIQDVLGELRAATEYVRNIPVEAKGYRISSLVCLLPAYQTIVTAAQNQPRLFTSEHRFKISREMMVNCLHEAVTMATDNDAITAHCQQLDQAVTTAFWAEPIHS